MQLAVIVLCASSKRRTSATRTLLSSIILMSTVEDIMGLDRPSDGEEESVYLTADSDIEERGRTTRFKSQKRGDTASDEEEDINDEEEDENVAKQTETEAESKQKMKILSEEENLRKLKEIKRSGVVYLSSIPPYMKPVKMKQILSRFGEVGRIYLAPEDAATHSRRVRSGGNRKKKYTEGWAEFINKKHAKLAAEVLNGNPIGGKKGNFYYDDILNIKYLPKFKWHDLTEQIALEVQERQEKLKAEIALATKENRVFIDNVEQKERVEYAKRKASEAGEAGEETQAKKPRREEVRRNFTQKPTKPQSSKNSAELSKVLSSIF